MQMHNARSSLLSTKLNYMDHGDILCPQRTPLSNLLLEPPPSNRLDPPLVGRSPHNQPSPHDLQPTGMSQVASRLPMADPLQHLHSLITQPQPLPLLGFPAAIRLNSLPVCCWASDALKQWQLNRAGEGNRRQPICPTETLLLPVAHLANN